MKSGYEIQLYCIEYCVQIISNVCLLHEQMFEPHFPKFDHGFSLIQLLMELLMGKRHENNNLNVGMIKSLNYINIGHYLIIKIFQAHFVEKWNRAGAREREWVYIVRSDKLCLLMHIIGLSWTESEQSCINTLLANSFQMLANMKKAKFCEINDPIANSYRHTNKYRYGWNKLNSSVIKLRCVQMFELNTHTHIISIAIGCSFYIIRIWEMRLIHTLLKSILMSMHFRAIKSICISFYD